MKRVSIFQSTVLFALTAGTASCHIDLPVDSRDDNPQVLAPAGAIRGFVNYLGPGPCIRKGKVEGALVILGFDANNPPPPDGLATTALQIATIPGEELFKSYPRPVKAALGGPDSPDSLCPATDSPFVNFTAPFSLQQLIPKRWIVRAFYSRQNRFSPLYNFANLPLAGDVGGGYVDLTNPRRPFIPIDIGICDAPGLKCTMPATGFVRENVNITVGSVLQTHRPYFSIDYANSFGFDSKDMPISPDLTGDVVELATRRKKASDLGKQIVFRQDHAITSRQNLACAGNPDQKCDIFQFAQPSFPAIRFAYGFPGNPDNAAGGLPDAWLAKNAKPREPFSLERIRKYYGIDPFEFASTNPISGKFALIRASNSKGEPEILRDNKTLEDVALIALLFPTVVMSKQADAFTMAAPGTNPEVLDPPRSQTSNCTGAPECIPLPIVTISTFTVRNWPDGAGSMKATSEGTLTGGGLLDGLNPLSKSGGIESVDSFTALLRPSAACIYNDTATGDPTAKHRGILTTPTRYDANREVTGTKAFLVEEEKVLASNAARLYGVVIGCLPPGSFSANVVYNTGQAWSFPNLMGTCSATTAFRYNEKCIVPPTDLSSILSRGFEERPLLQSQGFFRTEADGSYSKDPITGFKVPQSVVILPSDRCGAMKAETKACNADADCASETPFRCVPDDTSGRKFCDYNGNGRIDKGQVWVTNREHEDVNGNGVLDPGEDTNGNGKLDLKTPYACLVPFKEFRRLYDNKSLPAAEASAYDRLLSGK